MIAFDEFQEVAIYPKKAEAILRTHIQTLQNIHFIFSGSSGHILQQMFLGATRPFFQSAEVVVLDKIDRHIYKDFIVKSFEDAGKTIEEPAVEFILDFSETYTYYTELLCNQCFAKTADVLTEAVAVQAANEYLETRKFDYQNILNLISGNQKQLSIALAKEGYVKKPNAMEFLSKHKLSGASSVNQALRVLLDKEILFQSPEGYKVYDVFFRRFLEKYY